MKYIFTSNQIVGPQCHTNSIFDYLTDKDILSENGKDIQYYKWLLKFSGLLWRVLFFLECLGSNEDIWPNSCHQSPLSHCLPWDWLHQPPIEKNFNFLLSWPVNTKTETVYFLFTSNISKVIKSLLEGFSCWLLFYLTLAIMKAKSKWCGLSVSSG